MNARRFAGAALASAGAVLAAHYLARRLRATYPLEGSMAEPSGAVRFAALVTEAGIEGHNASVDVAFAFTDDDPYAVFMRVDPKGRDARWIFAREILSDALLRRPPAVQRDVRALLAVRSLLLTLTAPGGVVTLRFDAQKVYEFVVATNRLVPIGRESDAVDWAEAEAVFDVPAGALTRPSEDTR